MRKLNAYSSSNCLNINKTKYKVCFLGKVSQKYSWDLVGDSVKQRFLLIFRNVFTDIGAWAKHFKWSSAKAATVSKMLIKLVNHNHLGTLLPILKVHKAKIVPILTYSEERPPYLYKIKCTFSSSKSWCRHLLLL